MKRKEGQNQPSNLNCMMKRNNKSLKTDSRLNYPKEVAHQFLLKKSNTIMNQYKYQFKTWTTKKKGTSSTAMPSETEMSTNSSSKPQSKKILGSKLKTQGLSTDTIPSTRPTFIAISIIGNILS